MKKIILSLQAFYTAEVKSIKELEKQIKKMKKSNPHLLINFREDK